MSKLTYTISECMIALCISRGTIYDLINSGKLKSYKIGRRRYTTHEALIECQRNLIEESAVKESAA